MKGKISTTVVTAGDRAFAWGALILVASMRRNGMNHPVIVGMTGWTDDMKSKVQSLGGVTLKELPPSRQCVTCQKPMLMDLDEIETDWVCWADSDGAFVGDCSEWLVGDNEDEIVIRKYNPKPWQMWNSYSLKWYDVVMPVADWLVENGVVKSSDLPIPLRKSWQSLCRAARRSRRGSGAESS